MDEIFETLIAKTDVRPQPAREINDLAVCDSPRSLTIPSNFAVLETLLGHTFTCKPLLLEAVTHPSHLSIPSTPSYQRLEYLGDALLDYLVTTTIFSLLRGFGIIDWVETALKEGQIRHPKEKGEAFGQEKPHGHTSSKISWTISGGNLSSIFVKHAADHRASTDPVLELPF